MTPGMCREMQFLTVTCGEIHVTPEDEATNPCPGRARCSVTVRSAAILDGFSSASVLGWNIQCFQTAGFLWLFDVSAGLLETKGHGAFTTGIVTKSVGLICQQFLKKCLQVVQTILNWVVLETGRVLNFELMLWAILKTNSTYSCVTKHLFQNTKSSNNLQPNSTYDKKRQHHNHHLRSQTWSSVLESVCPNFVTEKT